MVVSACNPITQEAEAGTTLSKEKSDFHKAHLSLQISLVSPVLAPLGQLASQPLPLFTDIPTVFEYELPSERDTR